MQPEVASRPASTRVEHRAALRLGGLIALLMVEALAFGLVFDADALRSLPPGWWTAAIPAFPASLRLAALMAAAAMLVGGRRLWDAIAEETRVWSARRIVPRLVVHLGCVAALFAISGKVFGVVSSQSRHPAGWIVCWVVGCIACGVSWLFAVLPGRAMGRLLVRFGWVIAAAALVGIVAWAAGQTTQSLWVPLRALTLHAAYVILRVFDHTAFVDAPKYIIGAGHFAVEINPQCSGYEGIGLCWVFAAAYWWFFRDALRFPQALVLLPVMTLASWLGNVARIALLVLIGAHGSPQLALGGFQRRISLISSGP